MDAPPPHASDDRSSLTISTAGDNIDLPSITSFRRGDNQVAQAEWQTRGSAGPVGNSAHERVLGSGLVGNGDRPLRPTF